MAIAGSATSAYFCQVYDNALQVRSTTTLRSQCTPLPQAVDRLAAGERITVAGSDMAALRQAMREQGVYA